ncbi:terminase small subunit [Janthinobacterium fluminis]|uniref:Terminase small subunit n=1 Tax=Janthinobacterium fluminis TaxID=2987524 RepID=A0ABT5JVN6_9BURK|nr:terminase small subunit [Janthinobacterium fluminis]MDC8756250.1 terminase small subunit [Janthinobacterium fluminis]
MALTGKKQRFADAVLAGFSNKDAAIAAGYSAKTASAAGSRLVKDPDVKAWLSRGAGPAEKMPGASAVDVSPEPQAHGGALKRSKAGQVPIEETDMLQLLKDVALGRTLATTTQVRAAIAAVQYTHPKKGEGGKKDEKAEAAKVAGRGRFGAPPAPPRLVAGGKT